MLALEIVCWASLGLIAWTHAGYPLWLAAAARLRPPRPAPAGGDLPSVTLVIACHDEQAVIERKLHNALALDYPPDRLELLVASDGSSDCTVELARGLAAKHPRVRVLDLPRRGKVASQDAAVAEARGEIVAFSDANAFWDPDALRRLAAPFADPQVGYACGEVRFLTPAGGNQEGAYWSYEMAVRRLESRLSSVTGGNGAIYATRREAYIVVDPRMGHDLSFPFNMVKRGWRAVFEPAARAQEKMVPTTEGEFRRKRRMMSHAWPIVVRGGMLDPRGYGPLYGFMILSHRLLRYATPFLHLVLLGSSAALALAGAGTAYTVLVLAQLAFLLCAALAPLTRRRVLPLALCHYYVLVTASLAAGLWDWLRSGTPAVWEKAEGTR